MKFLRTIPALLYMLALITLFVFIWSISQSGAFLPSADENSSFSLRDVENRRSYYRRYHYFGK